MDVGCTPWMKMYFLLPFRELTYPIKIHFWVDDFPNFPRWDICEFRVSLLKNGDFSSQSFVSLLRGCSQLSSRVSPARVSPSLAVGQVISATAARVSEAQWIFWMDWVEKTYPPPKFNIEPENDGFSKGISFSRGPFSGSMLVSGRIWKINGDDALKTERHGLKIGNFELEWISNWISLLTKIETSKIANWIPQIGTIFWNWMKQIHRSSINFGWTIFPLFQHVSLDLQGVGWFQTRPRADDVGIWGGDFGGLEER